MEDGDDREGDDRGQCMSTDERPVVGQEVQARLDERGECRFANPAEAEGGERDAELTGGEEGVEPRDDPQHGRGQRMALRRQLLDPGTPHSHQGKLGGNEKAVGKDQQDDGQQSAGDVETGWLMHGCEGAPNSLPLPSYTLAPACALDSGGVVVCLFDWRGPCACILGSTAPSGCLGCFVRLSTRECGAEKCYSCSVAGV